MKLEQLKMRLGELPAGMTFTAAEVLRQLDRISDGGCGKPKREVQVKAPSGPGKAGYPCPCGEGYLLMKSCIGIEKSTGNYVRYRKCNACGQKVKTREVLEVALPETDGRTGDWRKQSKAGKQPEKVGAGVGPDVAAPCKHRVGFASVGGAK